MFACFVDMRCCFDCGPTYRVIQPVYMQYHCLGPLVGGAQEELGLPPAGRRRCLRLLRLLLARRLQDLIDLRRQQLGLPWRRGPGGWRGMEAG